MANAAHAFFTRAAGVRTRAAVVEVARQVEARRAACGGGSSTDALAHPRFTHPSRSTRDVAAAAVIRVRLGVDALVVAAGSASAALTEASQAVVAKAAAVAAGATVVGVELCQRAQAAAQCLYWQALVDAVAKAAHLTVLTDAATCAAVVGVENQPHALVAAAGEPRGAGAGAADARRAAATAVAAHTAVRAVSIQIDALGAAAGEAGGARALANTV